MQTVANILQIDVEDWFCDFNICEWDQFDYRVVQNTNKILALLKKRGINATFFILGSLAEKFPDLVRNIKADGHEVASHGYSHKRATDMSPMEFEEDLLKSLQILEDITGEKVLGYRAPQFTVVKKTSWVITILDRYGIKYDSSIFPAKTPFYGVPGAPLYPYRIDAENILDMNKKTSIWEIPLSIFKLPLANTNIPVAGGFYLRIFPYWFISWAIRKINRKGHPAVCYIHPWEIDPDFPKVNSLRWTYYYKLRTTEKKFCKLLDEFKFISTIKWLELNDE